MLSIIIFIAFSLLCSAVYIMNDYKDVEKDRLHPTKKNRPLASGRVSKPAAIILMVFLFAEAVVLMLLTHLGYKVILCACSYVLINIIYSFGGKNIPILDIILLGSGYPLRVIIGGYAVNIAVSEWLFLTMLCVSFYLALGKRCGELKRISLYKEDSEEKTNMRPVLKCYTVPYLEKHMYLSMGLGIVFYSLWTIEKSSYFVWTVTLVLIICMLYNLILMDTDGDPIEVLISSKPLMFLIIVYGFFIAAILYCT